MVIKKQDLKRIPEDFLMLGLFILFCLWPQNVTCLLEPLVIILLTLTTKPDNHPNDISKIPNFVQGMCQMLPLYVENTYIEVKSLSFCICFWENAQSSALHFRLHARNSLGFVLNPVTLDQFLYIFKLHLQNEVLIVTHLGAFCQDFRDRNM